MTKEEAQPQPATSLTSRSFSWAEQQRFAMLSGDHNPIHVDPERARRTITGGLVVHGVHLLLWALEALAAHWPGSPPPIRRIQARFQRFTYLDEPVSVVLRRRDELEGRVVVQGGGVVRADVRIFLGDPEMLDSDIAPLSATDRTFPAAPEPIDTNGDDIDGLAGRIAALGDPSALPAHFAGASGWLGSSRVEGLAAVSRLVGMVCPGLHSVLTGIDVRTTRGDEAGGLEFAMGEARHGMIPGRISGRGISGSIHCLIPAPPVRQGGIEALRALVDPTAFAGHTALVIGGSRGLGEVAAKLVAAGGGEVLLGYHQGKRDAERIGDDIGRSGGRCSCLRLDVTSPFGPQWPAEWSPPTHVYYFATPMIARPAKASFDRGWLERLQLFYVHGFWQVVDHFERLRPGTSYFYPLPELGEDVTDLPEYAVAKAGGGTLCACARQHFRSARILSAPLPWMCTDQTIRLRTVEPAPDMQPLVEAVLAFHAR